jgi:phosphate transport system permease protein
MPDKPKRKLGTLLAEAAIKTSGWVTSFIVLLMVFYLFREGVGLFTAKPVTEDYVIAVHSANPITKLEPKQLQLIHEKKIKNWKDVGGADQDIFILNMNNLDKYVKEGELGEGFSQLTKRLGDLANEHPGIIMAFPQQFLPSNVKALDLGTYSLGSFIGGTEWYPTTSPTPLFGALPLLLGTFLVTLGAIVVALPLGLAVAIYLAELADERVGSYLKPMIELMAGIPSVVYGFFGLVVIVPLIQGLFNLSVGETALAGSILLAIIALPPIITVSEDAIKAVPRNLKEASLALGATQWQTITRVVVPYAFNGISAATILGVGRAVGETMTVLMVTGNAAVIPQSFLVPVRTLSATIAAELGEAPQGGLHYKALFAVGCLLFLVTFAFNLLAQYVSQRSRMQPQ